MKVRLFVSGSAVALAAWLGVTYVRAVPVQHYPQLGRDSLPISAKRERAKAATRSADMERAKQAEVAEVAKAGD